MMYICNRGGSYSLCRCAGKASMLLASTACVYEWPNRERPAL